MPNATIIRSLADEGHIRGWADAAVELIEYGDFRCTRCADAYVQINHLKNALGNQLKFVFRHFPGQDRFPLSVDAAVLSELAAVQDKFWDLHDMLFESQFGLTKTDLLDLAHEAELNVTDFANEEVYSSLRDKVLCDRQLGYISGVQETPAFFINGRYYPGPAEFPSLFSACIYAQQMPYSPLGK